jgi:hypothetical protein
MFTCNTICICLLLPKCLKCLLQSRNSISEQRTGLSEIPEQNIVSNMTRRCFQFLLTVRSVTRYETIELVTNQVTRPRIFVILSLRIGGKLQNKIIVIVSLFMKSIFHLNCSQNAGDSDSKP